MKICVIGLDCCAPDVVFNDERLVNIRRLMDLGLYGRLESVIPPITVPAWMCMTTSQDPGSLGVYGFHKGDTYSDTIRTTGSIAGNPAGLGIMSGAQDQNSATALGLDFTLSLAPWGIPVGLENQLMRRKETNPTGFGQEFSWKGGFHQLNWYMSKNTVVYARYDYLKGDPFDDTISTVNAVTGITRSTPKEHDLVLGWQHLYEQNVKLVFDPITRIAPPRRSRSRTARRACRGPLSAACPWPRSESRTSSARSEPRSVWWWSSASV